MDWGPRGSCAGRAMQGLSITCSANAYLNPRSHLWASRDENECADGSNGGSKVRAAQGLLLLSGYISGAQGHGAHHLHYSRPDILHPHPNLLKSRYRILN